MLLKASQSFRSAVNTISSKVPREWLLFGFVAAVLVLIWFRKGMILGGGEAGIPYYNLSFFSQESTNAWSEQGLGSNQPIVATSALYLVLVAPLQVLGVPGFILEAATFWAILVVGSTCVSRLTSRCQGSDKIWIPAVLAGLFYMLNPYVMIVVWNRFLYSFMFMYAALPFALLMTVWGVEKRTLRAALYMNLGLLLLSLGYGSPALVGTLWIVLLSYFVYAFVGSKARKQRIFIAKLALMSASLWFLFNLWWLLPLLHNLAQVTAGFAAGDSVGTLLAFKDGTNPLNLLLLKSPVWENYVAIWPSVYESALYDIIAFAILGLAVLGFLKGWNNGFVRYFTFLTILGILLAKGAAPPFGEAFLAVFSNVTYLQLFRNTYEKLGFILVLGLSPLFGLGLYSFYVGIRTRLRLSLRLTRDRELALEQHAAKASLLIAILLILGILVWPMWTGQVFSSGIPPMDDPEIGYNVRVPDYYKRASEWFAERPGEYRTVVFPLGGEGITFNWSFGYAGSEPTNMLLDIPSVSITHGIPFLDDIVTILERSLSNTTQFWKAMSLLNARFIVLRSDVDFLTRGMTSPEEIENMLNASGGPSIVGGRVSLDSSDLRYVYGNQSDLRNWTVVWANAENGPPELTEDSEITKQANFSLVFRGQPLALAGGESAVGLHYGVPPDGRDWSKMKFLLMWLNVSQPGPISVSLSSQNGFLGWDGRKDSDYSINIGEESRWKLLVMPLANPTDRSADVDIRNITRLGVAYWTTQDDSTLTMKISGIFADIGLSRKMEKISLATTIGKLRIFEVQPEVLPGVLYAVERIRFVESSKAMLLSEINNPAFDPRTDAAIVRSQVSEENVDLSHALSQEPRSPEVKWHKVDSSLYEVAVGNASRPFLLILSQSFSPFWDALVDGTKLPPSHHFVVNGFANGWLIESGGNLSITLRFQLQTDLVVGSILASSAVLISIAVGVERRYPVFRSIWRFTLARLGLRES